MSSHTKVHTYQEVAKHGRTGDCWVILHGKVYDLSSFLEGHPGGNEVLLTASGKDSTNDYEDVGHSDDARDIMKNFYIGEVDISSAPVREHNPAPVESSKGNNNSGRLFKILQFLIPLLIWGLAYAYRQSTKKE